MQALKNPQEVEAWARSNGGVEGLREALAAQAFDGPSQAVAEAWLARKSAEDGATALDAAGTYAVIASIVALS